MAEKLKITTQMKTIVEEKEKLVEQLNKKATTLLEKELYEKTTRVQIVTKMQKESQVKLTDKTKQAEADSQLKDTIVEIAKLKNEMDILKRKIELCNDKLSLHRNMIRELELLKL